MRTYVSLNSSSTVFKLISKHKNMDHINTFYLRSQRAVRNYKKIQDGSKDLQKYYSTSPVFLEEMSFK